MTAADTLREAAEALRGAPDLFAMPAPEYEARLNSLATKLDALVTEVTASDSFDFDALMQEANIELAELRRHDFTGPARALHSVIDALVARLFAVAWSQETWKDTP